MHLVQTSIPLVIIVYVAPVYACILLVYSCIFQAHAVRERELESTIRELQVSVEQHEADRRKRQWEIEDLIKEKQIAIERSAL